MTHPLASDPIAQGLTASGITQLCDDALANAEILAAAIRALREADPTGLTWESTFGAFDRIAHNLQEASYVPQLYALAHPEEAVRSAALACEPKVSAFASALLMDDAVAATLRRAADALNAAPLSPAQKRLIEHTLRDYRRNGLELPPEGRTRLHTLNEEITALGQTFEQNIAADTPSIRIPPEQLEGLSESYIAAHPVAEDGLVRVTTDYPDLVPFLRDAKDRRAARELYARSQNRAREKNLPILDTLLALRKEKATLLGYPTWAHYALEPRMAKTPDWRLNDQNKGFGVPTPRTSKKFCAKNSSK
jgi:thimet oligopeptidase